MTYAKLENSKIVYLKLPFYVNGSWCYTKNDSLIRQAGYKELVNTAQPNDNKRYVLGDYIETDTQIITTWIEKPYTEEEKHKLYKSLTEQYIAERYSFSEELGIKNDYEYDTTNLENAEKYYAYQQYRIDCKARAHKEVYGY